MDQGRHRVREAKRRRNRMMKYVFQKKRSIIRIIKVAKKAITMLQYTSKIYKLILENSMKYQIGSSKQTRCSRYRSQVKREVQYQRKQSQILKSERNRFRVLSHQLVIAEEIQNQLKLHRYQKVLGKFDPSLECLQLRTKCLSSRNSLCNYG